MYLVSRVLVLYKHPDKSLVVFVENFQFILNTHLLEISLVQMRTYTRWSSYEQRLTARVVEPSNFTPDKGEYQTKPHPLYSQWYYYNFSFSFPVQLPPRLPTWNDLPLAFMFLRILDVSCRLAERATETSGHKFSLTLPNSKKGVPTDAGLL